LFGLRKTGKTSVIFGIERVLTNINEKALIIDCQNPSFHLRRWNQALAFIINSIVQKYNLNLFDFCKSEEYTEIAASTCFEIDISVAHRLLENKKILLIFDEIENVTFETSPSEHWEKGLDFLLFWQTIRSIFQKNKDYFSFLVVGTNPICVEKPTIKGKDNPIFNAIPYQYIERFDVPETREMVRKLGRLMGIKFDESIYTKLTEDYGGHPFLIRHVCSLANKLYNTERPIEISRKMYGKAKEEFDNRYFTFVEMILSVLKDFYKDEYDMLIILANDDIDAFRDLAIDNPSYTNHLLGYGIISNTNGYYDFRIDAVKKYLLREEKYKKNHP
jgi:hypothetical protein